MFLSEYTNLIELCAIKVYISLLYYCMNHGYIYGKEYTYTYMDTYDQEPANRDWCNDMLVEQEHK